jgi:hypothetical protein
MTSRERCGGQGDGTAGKAGAERNGDEWEAATLELGPAHTDDVYVVSFKASYALGGKGASDSEMQMYIAEILVRARLRGSEVQTGKAKEEEMHANSKNGVTTCTDSTTATTPCGKEALDHDVADKTLDKAAERALDEVTIYPASHFVTSEEQRTRVLADIRAELRARVRDLEDTGRVLEAERLLQRTTADLVAIETAGYCRGVENYARHLAGRKAGQTPESLLDYFPPDDWLLIVDESHISVPQVRVDPGQPFCNPHTSSLIPHPSTLTLHPST